MKIPFVDLRAQYLAHKESIDAALSQVIETTAFVGGPPVAEFETAFRQLYEVPCFISCGNGTDAIFIALKMLGIGPGDEVVTSAHSWIATSEVITQAGARPVFVDVDDFYTIDAGKIEEKISENTKAIIPVHLYGQSADMGTLVPLCQENGLKLIEDCAQAHLAEWQGRKVGTFGHAGTFSFYPGKNLGAYGDAGGIITDDLELGRGMRMFANHGAEKKHSHLLEGINSRLDGMQAAVLSAKQPFLRGWTDKRQSVAAAYDELLTGIPDISIPRRRSESTHVFHLYVIQADRREDLAAFLKEKGIMTGIHYPTALPLLPAYNYLGYSESDFPQASANQSRILSLPIYPEMTAEMVEYVADHIRFFYSG